MHKIIFYSILLCFLKVCAGGSTSSNTDTITLYCKDNAPIVLSQDNIYLRRLLKAQNIQSINVKGFPKGIVEKTIQLYEFIGLRSDKPIIFDRTSAFIERETDNSLEIISLCENLSLEELLKLLALASGLELQGNYRMLLTIFLAAKLTQNESLGFFVTHPKKIEKILENIPTEYKESVKNELLREKGLDLWRCFGPFALTSTITHDTLKDYPITGNCRKEIAALVSQDLFDYAHCCTVGNSRVAYRPIRDYQKGNIIGIKWLICNNTYRNGDDPIYAYSYHNEQGAEYDAAPYLEVSSDQLTLYFLKQQPHSLTLKGEDTRMGQLFSISANVVSLSLEQTYFLLVCEHAKSQGKPIIGLPTSYFSTLYNQFDQTIQQKISELYDSLNRSNFARYRCNEWCCSEAHCTIV